MSLLDSIIGHEGEVKVGVLSFHNSKETKAILNAVENLGHEGIWLKDSNLSFQVDSNEATMNPDVDIVVNRLLFSIAEESDELIGALRTIEKTGTPVLNGSNSTLSAMYKPESYAILTRNNIPIAKTSVAYCAKELNKLKYDFDGHEFVYKPTIGAHGDGVQKRRDFDTLGSRIGKYNAMVQEYLKQESEQFDIRVYVVGDEVIGAMRRGAPDGDWRTNVSRGGKPEYEEVSAEIEKTAIRATNALDLDYAGIDLMRQDNVWKVIEVNATAGFRGFFKATDISPAPYIAGLALKSVGVDVEQEKVVRLANKFDSSIPTSYPFERIKPSENEIDYSTTVSISGQKKTTEVVAKSDTGAKRTSIDSKLAAKIGAGPITGTTNVKSANSETSRLRPLVSIKLRINENEHEVKASVEDRSHMSTDLLLGRDILKNYSVRPNEGD